MNVHRATRFFVATLAGGGFLMGCATEPTATSSRHPGPVAGKAVGAGAGVVVGNAAGAVVGVGEGFAGGVSAPFDSTRRTVRRWHTETTSDGRQIQVSEDIEVDAQGRPLKSATPK